MGFWISTSEQRVALPLKFTSVGDRKLSSLFVWILNVLVSN